MHEGIRTPGYREWCEPRFAGDVQVGWSERREPVEDDGTSCLRWPESLRLASSGGALVLGRCKATNLCRYCQKLYVLETVEMLTLDAVEYAPTIWLVLTAREHLTRADCTEHLRKLRRALRRRWPHVEWFVQVEFQRRGALHLNLLVKGVAVEQRECDAWLLWDHRSGVAAPSCGGCVRCVASELWCARVDAEPQSQWTGPIDDGVGVVRYISKMLAHGLKAEQRPPIGWRGHRTSQTRGYLVRPASAMRREARDALRGKRELHKAIEAGYDGGEAALVAEAEVLRAEATRWQLVKLTVDRETGAFVASALDGSEPAIARAARARDFERDAAYAEGYRALDAGVEEVDEGREKTRPSRRPPPKLKHDSGFRGAVELPIDIAAQIR